MARRYSYDCVLTREDDGYVASFPQLPGCFTDGDTREEAIANASEALQAFMAGYAEGGQEPPAYERAAEVVTVSVEVTDEDLDEMRYMTQSAAADALGVSPSRVSALIGSGRLEARWFDGARKVSVASVNAYASSPRRGGRPPSGDARRSDRQAAHGASAAM